MQENGRPIVELLVIMKQNQQFFKFGLCAWVTALYTNRIISDVEYVALRDYIDKNPPKWYQQFPYSIYKGPYFFWPRKLKPRLMWIDCHIKKLSKPPSDYYGPF